MKNLSLEEIVKIAEDERRKWMTTYSKEENIKLYVRTKLDQVIETAVFSFLGIKKEYGRMELDRTNGRRSPISEYLEKHVSALLPSLLSKVLAKMEKEDLGKETITSLENYYVEHLRYSLRTAMQNRAEQHAREVIEIYMKDADDKLKEFADALQYQREMENDAP